MEDDMPVALGEVGPGNPTLAESIEISADIASLLLSLVDALPDDTVLFVRRALARQAHVEALQGLTFEIIRWRVSLYAEEAELLRSCLHEFGEDTNALDFIPIATESRPVTMGFDAGESVPADDKTNAILASFLTRPGVLGVWRAARRPLLPTPWPPPRDTVLLELDSQDAADDLERELYGPNVDTDAADHQRSRLLIEAYITGMPLPPMLEQIWLDGTLLRAPERQHDFAFVDLPVADYDPATGDITEAAPEEVARLDDDEAEIVLAYLAAGRPLTTADSHSEDVLDAARPVAVPMDLCTDGRWVWSQAIAYYLAEHRVAPPEPFLSAVREHGTSPLPPVCDATLCEALAWMQSAPA